jgi:hypothetical protein
MRMKKRGTIYRKIILFLGLFSLSALQVLAESEDSTAIAKIKQVREYIEKNNRMVEQLDSSTFFNLPVGIKEKGLFSLCITDATIKPGGATFTAVLQIDDPLDSTKQLTRL